MGDVRAEEALTARRDALWKQLEAGYKRIERGVDDHDERTTDWIAFWRELLDEYERVNLELQRTLAV